MPAEVNATASVSRVRWMLRFSLRTFFVLLTMACVAGGWYLNRVQRQRAAVQAIEKQGGLVLYDVVLVEDDLALLIEHFNAQMVQFGGVVRQASDEPRPLSKSTLRGKLALVLGIDFVATPKRVTFDQSVVNPDLRPLHNLPQLERVQLYRCSDPAMLKQLRGLRSLQSLILTDRSLEDIRSLAKITQLRRLELNGTGVHDLSPLADLVDLEFLDISFTPVEDLSALSELSCLQSIALYQSKVTDLKPLYQLRKLRSIEIGEFPISDEEVGSIRAALPECTVLVLPVGFPHSK
jgi:hypothetical protein